MKALLVSISIYAVLLVSPSPGRADTIQPGDVLIAREPGLLCVHKAGGAFWVTKPAVGAADLVVTKSGRILCASWSRGAIVEVNPTTGAQTVFATGGYIVHPGALALSADGSLLLLDFGVAASPGNGRLLRIDPVSAKQTVLHTGDGAVYVGDLAELPNGDILVGERNGGDSGVFRWDHLTGEETKVTRDTVDVTSIVVEPQGNIYFTWSPDAASDVGFELDQLDLSTGSRSKITGLWEAFQMAQAPDGTLFIADGLGFGVDHVDPTNGAYLGEINCQPDIVKAVAVWPDGAVPTQTSTWGRLKARYR